MWPEFGNFHCDNIRLDGLLSGMVHVLRRVTNVGASANYVEETRPLVECRLFFFNKPHDLLEDNIQGPIITATFARDAAVDFAI